MIFHQYHCILIQNPKTAMTSILTALGLNWNHPDVLLANNITDPIYPPTAIPQYGITPARTTASSYLRFSTVRNPFDRLISGWKYCGYTKHRPLLDVLKNPPGFYLTPEMLAFLPHLRGSPDTEFGAYWHIFTTQHSRLFRPDGSLGVSFLIRYETLQEDFDRLCDLIEKPRCVLPHENRTERRPYQEYFDHDPEAKEIAERLFRIDLDSLGYHY
jgi:hypothetical protein